MHGVWNAPLRTQLNFGEHLLHVCVSQLRLRPLVFYSGAYPLVLRSNDQLMNLSWDPSRVGANEFLLKNGHFPQAFCRENNS